MYKKIKPYNYTETELRQIWNDEYCTQTIVTFDGIVVKFYSSMFNHCFYESADRRAKDKSILSLNRLEKILWIKEALQDPESLRKQGWISKEKRYDGSRRVTLVKGNYIVVINIYKEKLAKFVTAYEVNDDSNLESILKSPDLE